MNKNLDRFQIYYEKYQKMVMKAAECYVDSDTAEDITQETFLRLHEILDEMPDAKVKPWLLVVSDHLAKDCMKKGGKKKEIIMPAEVVGENIKETMKSPEDTLVEKEEKEAVRTLGRTALKKLYERDQTWYRIIVGTVCLGLSSRIVGEKLGMRGPHVNTTKERAKKYLRKELEKDYQKLI
ncbi:MAG: RNA polymerase sigma factor [Lachnospiraceae bacterium]